MANNPKPTASQAADAKDKVELLGLKQKLKLEVNYTDNIMKGFEQHTKTDEFKAGLHDDEV
jgi:hypothetical protein